MSSLLFVIGIEILARTIKNDAGIKGIKVGEKEIIKSPYMLMTPLFLFVTLVLLPIYYLCSISSKISPVWKFLILKRPKECGSVAGKITPKRRLGSAGRGTQ